MKDRQKWYIKSKPPTTPYLYHHAFYSGLKGIAEDYVIKPNGIKQTVSLTTDSGRYLTPLSFLPLAYVDGVVRLPYDEQLRELAIPVLYTTYNSELVNQARLLGYEIFDIPPLEYKYILMWTVKNDMFVNENEYVVINQCVGVGNADLFIDPKKLKRFKNGLRRGAVNRIFSLMELKNTTNNKEV